MSAALAIPAAAEAKKAVSNRTRRDKVLQP